MIFGELCGIFSNHDEAPRRHKRELNVGFGTVGERCNIGKKMGASLRQIHSAVVVKRGFVNGEIGATWRLDSEWSVN